MFRKSVEGLVTVALKFFFDIDSSYSHHAFVIIFVIIGSIKIFAANCVDELHIGCQTVAKDAHLFRNHVVEVKNRLVETDAYASIKMQLRSLREVVNEKIPINWE